MSIKAVTKCGLIDRIELAESIEEINSLLAEGKTYEGATSRTQNRWRIKANLRRQQLKGNNHE
jgi:hypothetical protein